MLIQKSCQAGGRMSAVSQTLPDKLCRFVRNGVGATVVGLLSTTVLAGHALSAAPQLVYDQPAQGFIPEIKGAAGFASGTGFATENPWGEYTAYLMATNARKQRTWRIEHYLPMRGQGMAQGSTMYLLEGQRLALLIDTGNPATEIEGVNDLKTVVRHLLGHDSKGKAKRKPLDFVVANTHNHGDHVGENARMSDRTVYYMDLDWPQKAPDNYVPIREGGGPTQNGKGQAVGEIDLGGRLIKAIAVPPHSRGSTAYLDADNRLLISGDALGSAWPFVQGGPLTQFAETMHHVAKVTEPYPDINVLPAHFYQTAAYERGRAPLHGRPLDRQYILDMETLVDGVLAGTIVGEPFNRGRDVFRATHDSAQMVYSLSRLTRPGENIAPYRAIRVPGPLLREWMGDSPDQLLHHVAQYKAEFYLIRDTAGVSLFLIRGSSAALLIGTGSGAPGLAQMIRSLVGEVPLEVALLDDSQLQVSGLAQLSPRKVYVGQRSARSGANDILLHNGDMIDLGRDSAGRPLQLEAQNFAAAGPASLTLLARGDEMMFVGEVLGRQGDMQGLRVTDPDTFQVTLTDWMGRTAGRFDALYLAPNSQWVIDPAYLDELQQVLSCVFASNTAVTVDTSVAGVTRYSSGGMADVKAVITVPAPSR